ncbi:Adenine-specific DNA methylase [Dehalococcoides mccartyi]|uniref:DNA methyltransferase n=1 Tax=Dehalococcoides mccartyi TaxID=61435 RepID=UPI0015E7B4A1|nr:DNA methyltransferase [Dehalococcoides mccartyi]MBA2084203.1 Adenine-specific DNA methylase [Dehalococcoides mccartyi]
MVSNPSLDTQLDWTFKESDVRENTHCYHDYPARMIPQIARQLLELYSNGGLLFDPYCGTGTSLVESLIHGIDAVGTDINPLACLISRSKITMTDTLSLQTKITDFEEFVLKSNNNIPEKFTLPAFENLGFWFKPQVILKIGVILGFINQISDLAIRDFFKVALSETIRKSSNTRPGEFKLYRRASSDLAKFDPDVFKIMLITLYRNQKGLIKTMGMISNSRKSVIKVYDFNTMTNIPKNIIKPESVDIVITSPPYGDSHTTVAYGQYSRLSAEWLGLENPRSVDKISMGGKLPKNIIIFDFDPLDAAINSISNRDTKRAREVCGFYEDLESSVSNVASVIAHGGHACYVVANRKVKGNILPTDLAVRHFFESQGFTYVNTFNREIPNKRMPLRNSPTNVSGLLDETMSKEFIVVMKKK